MEGGGYMQRQHSPPEIGHVVVDQHHPDCYKYSQYSVPGLIFIPISLRPVLRIVMSYIMATVWSSCKLTSSTW